MASNKERIAEYLASGLPAAQVASIVGCTPAYISQLKKEESFQLILSQAETATVESAKEDKLLENRYQSLEHAAIERAHQALPFAELPAITALLRVVAERQDRAKGKMLPASAQGQGTNVVVNISIPAHAIPEVSLNGQREVTSIGGRNLAPMSAEGVRSLFSRMSSSPQGAAAQPAVEVIENDSISATTGS